MNLNVKNFDIGFKRVNHVVAQMLNAKIRQFQIFTAQGVHGGCGISGGPDLVSIKFFPPVQRRFNVH